MTPPVVRERAAAGASRIRLAGAALLAVLVLLTAWTAPWTLRMQSAWWDAHQTLWPRPVERLPVTVVEIDQKSLLGLGQWPWPRSTLAELLERIHAARPAVIALDLLMPEADEKSPQRLLGALAQVDPAVQSLLKDLPDHDATLARTLERVPAVLVFAGMPEAHAQAPLRSAPVTVAYSGDGPRGPSGPLGVTDYPGALTALDALNRHAAGWGLVSVDVSRGVVRRMPLLARIDGTLVPALALEMMRVATQAAAVRVTAQDTRVQSVAVPGLRVPVERDGTVRPYFSRHRPDRFVSAIDVLQGKVEASMLPGQLVIVGPTALALHDEHETPVGQRMSGAEIHAQLLENLIAGQLLHRPAWAPLAEAALLLLFGALLIWAMPRWQPAPAALLMVALSALPVPVAAAAFVTQRWLFDAATPGLYLLLLFLGLLMLTLADSLRQRVGLERVVQLQREERARMAGEVAAAQRIQMGTLPPVGLLAGDARLDLDATLAPAREVGGDLYDFFRLDARRLFVLVGDVSGKGLSASIFMAVSKALYKGAMLREPGADIGDIMATANAEVSRDNPTLMYVTVFAAILDLDQGELSYCNAGHDNPFVLAGPDLGAPAVRRLCDGDGPPLCTVDGYPYASARCRLRPGETLCLMTDGVSEAQNPAGELYGGERTLAQLHAWRTSGADPHELVRRLQADVATFTAGAEPADDLTILALRWNGPRAAGGA